MLAFLASFLDLYSSFLISLFLSFKLIFLLSVFSSNQCVSSFFPWLPSFSSLVDPSDRSSR